MPARPIAVKRSRRRYIFHSRDTGSRVIEYAQRHIRIAAPPHTGQPFEFQDWQKPLIRKIHSPSIRNFGLSTPRKNGKSAMLQAGVILPAMFPEGPLFHRRLKIGVVSVNFQQMLDFLNEITAILEESGDIEEVNVNKQYGRIQSAYGPELRCYAAGKHGATGSSLDWAIVDEINKMDESARPLIRSFQQSIASRGGKFVTISVMGDGTGQYLQQIEEQSKTDKHVFYKFFGAKPTDDPSDPKVWRRANPGLTGKRPIKSLEYMRNAARDAQFNAADMQEFLCWDLNITTSDKTGSLYTLALWMKCSVPNRNYLPAREGPFVLAADLGGSASMSAIACYWFLSGRLEVWGGFPETPPLEERGRRDGIGHGYVHMRDRGELFTYSGATTPIRGLFETVLRELGGEVPTVAVADTYRKDEFAAEVEFHALSCPVMIRRHGPYDGGMDARDSQKEVLDRKFRTARSPLLETAISHTRTKIDQGGNILVDKSKNTGRIDAAVAAMLALGVGRRLRLEEEDFEHGGQDGVYIPPPPPM